MLIRSTDGLPADLGPSVVWDIGGPSRTDLSGLPLPPGSVFVDRMEQLPSFLLDYDFLHVIGISQEVVFEASRSWLCSSKKRVAVTVVNESLDEIPSLCRSLPDTISLINYEVNDYGRTMVFGSSEEGDRPSTDLLTGLSLLESEAALNRSANDQISFHGKLAERYLSVLRFLEDAQSRVLSPTAVEVKPPASSDDADLLQKIAHLQRERDSLERKYDALSRSFLGRLTLLRWKRKR